LSKLELKFEYLRKFWNLYKLEENDLKMVREECMTERVALSALKSNN
jgi:hypothetical protein